MQILEADSGITILFKRVPSKLVSCSYYIKCGSVDETLPEQEGLCHALEHMLFQGTETKSWQQLSRAFRKAGSYSNAATDFGTTSYAIRCPTEFFDEAFGVLADQVYNSVMPQDRWEIESNTIISEIQDFLDTPDELLGALAPREAFGSNYKDPIGNIDNIRKSEVDDLKYFKNTFYKGKNIFISVTGNLTSKELLRVINKYDQWEKEDCPERKTMKFHFNPDNYLTVKPGIEQMYVSFLSPIAKYNSVDEEVALDIGMDLLYNYLYENIVWKLGLCYHAGSYFFDKIDGCEHMRIDAACSADKVEQVIEEIPKHLSSFLQEELVSSKIQEARLSYFRDTMEHSECPDTVVEWMAESYLEGRDQEPFEEVFNSIENVNDSAIQESITECLLSDRKLAVMVGDTAEFKL